MYNYVDITSERGIMLFCGFNDNKYKNSKTAALIGVIFSPPAALIIGISLISLLCRAILSIDFPASGIAAAGSSLAAVPIFIFLWGKAEKAAKRFLEHIAQNKNRY